MEEISLNDKEIPDKIKPPMDSRISWMSYAIFFSLGTLNNLCVEMTLCYSNDMAKDFHKEKFMSIFSLFSVVFAISIRMINAKWMLHIRHRTKNILVICFFVCGVSFMLLAKSTNTFTLTLFGSIFFGAGTSLGESNNLGFLKGFPPSMSGAYSSGTGLSGVIGSVFYLLLKLFHFSFYTVNLLILIFYPFYAFVFYKACVLKEYIETPQTLYEETILGNEQPANLKQVEINEAKVNEHLNIALIKKLWPFTAYLYFSFFLLYLLEYISNSWFTSHIVHNFDKIYKVDEKKPFFIEYGFEIAIVLYRVFLFAGRSMLSVTKHCFKQLLFFILVMIFIFYFLQTIFGTFFGYPTMFITLSFMAFIGGIIYCNIIYTALKRNTIPKQHKEIVINILGSFGELGMLCSAVLGLICLQFLP